jgi:hypothetical protein
MEEKISIFLGEIWYDVWTGMNWFWTLFQEDAELAYHNLLKVYIYVDMMKSFIICRPHILLWWHT